MKPLSLLPFLILLVSIDTFAQNNPRYTRKKFIVSVLDSASVRHDGYLQTVTDSSLVMLNTPVIYDAGLSSNGDSYSFKTISSVSIKRKSAVGRGILIGAIGGAALGAIIGAATYKSTPCPPDGFFCLDFGAGFSALLGAGAGTFSGAMLGAMLGAVSKKTFIIGGRREDFKKFQINVLDRAYGKVANTTNTHTNMSDSTSISK